MKNEISDLARRAREEYSNKGLQALIRNGVRFAIKDFWLEKLIQHRSISRSELRSLAAQKDRIWYLEEQDSLEISPPSHPRLRNEFAAYPYKYAPERPFVCELSNCQLLGQYAVGLTEGNKLITETAPIYQAGSIKKLGINFPAGYLRIAGFDRPRTEHQKFDRACPLITPYSSYYHWITEYLPKIRLLEYYTNETGIEPTVLITPNSRRFVRETLETVGYPSYEEWGGERANVDKLIVPLHRLHNFNYHDPPRSNYNPSRDDLCWLRKQVRSNIMDCEETTSPDRIYVSRQRTDSDHTSSRKVANYEDVEPILREFGFESYILEDLRFREQVRLFSEAEVIMGPHGAGLVNMIFSDNPMIIEMFPTNIIKPHFYFLSNIMGFEYESVITDSKEDDLLVDAGLFRKHLRSIL